jgi:hypothetical protein
VSFADLQGDTCRNPCGQQWRTQTIPQRTTESWSKFCLEPRLKPSSLLGANMTVALQINFALWGLLICAEIKIMQMAQLFF